MCESKVMFECCMTHKVLVADESDTSASATRILEKSLKLKERCAALKRIHTVLSAFSERQ